VVRRGSTTLVVVVLATVVVASAAFAASERARAKAACIVGAETWSGSAIVGGAEPGSVVAKKSFSDLTAAKDKELRKVVRAVVKDPDGERAVHAFGRWCKKRYPGVAKISESSFEVPLLSRKSG
jgi:hypothetical protein